MLQDNEHHRFNSTPPMPRPLSSGSPYNTQLSPTRAKESSCHEVIRKGRKQSWQLGAALSRVPPRRYFVPVYRAEASESKLTRRH
ncbi:hypothetical protein NSPZN2_30183 [Nitrospira defluvii]|uniref:Uncharacterized protein n=1 Tax=Nitrospira defluvii TaxID=330214 RepID=A0ABM8RG90_9BACT|nr:hypothetical protein NSPZN2_30183 [Nitrospira defluvii]